MDQFCIFYSFAASPAVFFAFQSLRYSSAMDCLDIAFVAFIFISWLASTLYFICDFLAKS